MLYTAENPIRALLVMEPSVAHWVRDQLFIVAEVEIIDATASGERGLDIVHSAKPDIVLVGLELADMKGPEFLARLEHALPAVVVSVGSISSGIARQAVMMGAADVLVTPSTEQLADTIRNVVFNWLSDAPTIETSDSSEVEPVKTGGTPKEPPVTGGRVFCFYSPKGGVGTSYLAAAVARALQVDFDRQVALLDLGASYGVQASLFEIPEAEYVNMEQLAAGAAPQDLLLRHRCGLYLVAGASSFKDASLQREQAEQLVRYLKSRCDIVIIDCGPALDYNARAAFDLSDLVFVVTSPERPAMESLTRFYQFATETLRYSPALFRVVLNKSSATLESRVNYPHFAEQAPFVIAHRVPLLPDDGASLLRGASIDDILEIGKSLTGRTRE